MNRRYRFASWQAATVPGALPAESDPSQRLINPAAQMRPRTLRHLLALRGLPADTVLIVMYIALSRAFFGDEATLGVKIGPLPLFVTDVTLLALVALSLRSRSGRLLNWVFGGGGAGKVGLAVWLLFLTALVYSVFAFPEYGIAAWS